MRSFNFSESVENHLSDYGIERDRWTLDNIYTEAVWIAQKYETDGFSQYDAFHSEDKEEKREARSEHGKLRRLCAALAKDGAIIQGSAPVFN